jgi:hypothetical protein
MKELLARRVRIANLHEIAGHRVGKSHGLIPQIALARALTVKGPSPASSLCRTLAFKSSSCPAGSASNIGFIELLLAALCQ